MPLGSVIASNADSYSWSNQPMKFQKSVDASRISFPFHWLCTQLFMREVAAFCNCFSSEIMWHPNIDGGIGILLVIYPVTSCNVNWRGWAEGKCKAGKNHPSQKSSQVWIHCLQSLNSFSIHFDARSWSIKSSHKFTVDIFLKLK